MALINGLISYYKADVDGTFLDETANDYDGTINNATFDASGKINGCYDFNGSNASIAISGIQAGLGNAGTISLWVNTDDVADGYMFEHFETNDRLYLIFTTGGNIRIGYKSATATTTGLGLSVSTWYHIVLTWNGNNYNLYVNDVAKLNKTDSGASAWGTTNPYQLGKSWNNSNYLDGRVDELGIWDREITSGEITSLYNSGTGLQYPFSEGTNFQVNIGDVWKAVPLMKINIGDVWKPVVGVQINIGDVWKTIL